LVKCLVSGWHWATARAVPRQVPAQPELSPGSSCHRFDDVSARSDAVSCGGLPRQRAGGRVRRRGRRSARWVRMGARLPLQLLFIAWALRSTRQASRPRPPRVTESLDLRAEQGEDIHSPACSTRSPRRRRARRRGGRRPRRRSRAGPRPPPPGRDGLRVSRARHRSWRPGPRIGRRNLQRRPDAPPAEGDHQHRQRVEQPNALPCHLASLRSDRPRPRGSTRRTPLPLPDLPIGLSGIGDGPGLVRGTVSTADTADGRDCGLEYALLVDGPLSRHGSCHPRQVANEAVRSGGGNRRPPK
jgi:hypothetical protein